MGVELGPWGAVKKEEEGGNDAKVKKEEIAAAAIQEDVDAVGLSSLSGAHMRLFPAVVNALGKAGAPEIPVLGGGVIPDDDIVALKEAGIVEIFTPGTPVDKIIGAFQDACKHKTAG